MIPAFRNPTETGKFRIFYRNNISLQKTKLSFLIYLLLYNILSQYDNTSTQIDSPIFLIVKTYVTL